MKRNDNVQARRSPELDQLKKEVRAEESVCYLCDDFVNVMLKAGLPGSPEVDHVTPVEYCITVGINPNTRENLRLTHRWCNNQKGVKRLTHKLKREIATGWRELQDEATEVIDFGIDFVNELELDCD